MDDDYSSVCCLSFLEYFWLQDSSAKRRSKNFSISHKDSLLQQGVFLYLDNHALFYTKKDTQTLSYYQDNGKINTKIARLQRTVQSARRRTRRDICSQRMYGYQTVRLRIT